MLKWIKSLGSRKTSDQKEAVYRVPIVEKADLGQYPKGIEQIVSRDLDGFLIPDFLSEKEVEEVLRGFAGLKESELISVDNGFVSYPRSFAQFEQGVHSGELSAEGYYREAIDMREGFENRFGVDIEGKIRDVLEQIAPEKLSQVPVDRDGFGSFVPFTFRELSPGSGCLKAHCENYFFHEFPAFFERFKHFTQNEDQMSFFVVLQHPQAGGELTMFDLLWKNARKRPDDHTVLTEDGKRIDLENQSQLRRDQLRPQAGSLVIFKGGEIWHRVEHLSGTRSRITLGGFLSFSPNQDTIYLWS